MLRPLLRHILGPMSLLRQGMESLAVCARLQYDGFFDRGFASAVHFPDSWSVFAWSELACGDVWNPCYHYDALWVCTFLDGEYVWLC
jgi:hypothetical protein